MHQRTLQHSKARQLATHLLQPLLQPLLQGQPPLIPSFFFVCKEKGNSVPSVPPGNVTDGNMGGTLGHFTASRQRPERPASVPAAKPANRPTGQPANRPTGQPANHADLGREVRPKFAPGYAVTKRHTLSHANPGPRCQELPATLNVTSGGGSGHESGDASTV